MISEVTGIELIQAERQRQIDVEGWSPENDDQQDAAEMVFAAIAYAAAACNEPVYLMQMDSFPSGKAVIFSDPWPWNKAWDKRPPGPPTPDQRIRMLVKAGALIAAEIDRLHRKAEQENK